MARKKKGGRNKDNNIIHVNMNEEPTSILTHMKMSDQPGDTPCAKEIPERVNTDDELEIGSDEEIVEVEVEVSDSNASNTEDENSNQEDSDRETDNDSNVSQDQDNENELVECQGTIDNTCEEGVSSQINEQTPNIKMEEDLDDNDNDNDTTFDQPDVSPTESSKNEAKDVSDDEKINDKTQDIRVLFGQSNDKNTNTEKQDTASQATPDTNNGESQTDETIIKEKSTNKEASYDTPIAVEIDKGSDNRAQYVLMGLTDTNNSKRVFTLLGENVKDFQPLNSSSDKLSYNLNSLFNGQFRIPSDPILTQRTAIYVQSYQSGGICINPAYHRINEKSFQNYFRNTKGSVFLFLDKIKPQQRCIQAAKRHGIRGGRPERELQVDGQLFYTKNAKHGFWIDLLKLLQRRYNQTVPRGERIDSISKYGRNYLGGADLLTEAYARFGGKYPDVVVVGKDVYNAFFTKVQ